MKYLILFLLVSCAEDPISVTTNGEFKIGKLFTHEGCTVYRFMDGMNYRYFTNCTSTFWKESCGKNCTRNMEISR
jgi:hypothetical protein